ncbi:MAG: peptidoglycan-binding protein, partial [Clostridia bacterium]
KTANGKKTGTVLAKGTVVDLLAQPSSVAGYTWYRIRTASGLIGYVRGDCATASMGGGGGGGGGGGVPSTTKTFVRLPGNTELFTTEQRPSSGIVMVSAGTVLQMVSPNTYVSGGETYCSLYYNNTKYNAIYGDLSGGIMNDSDLASYVSTLWSGALNGSLKQELDLVGDVRVYAMQLALTVLNFYTGALDGSFGGASASAVRNFQRKNSLEVDGACGSLTWAKLGKQALAVSGGGSSGGGGGGGGGGGIVVTNFGTVNSVERATWNRDDNGARLIPKGSSATVMDVGTGKVFSIYRWSGASHADCVPLTENDTRIMCDIVGLGGNAYNSAHPTSSQLAQIKADSSTGHMNYTWPDFNNAWGKGKDVGSQWDRRPALLNVGGRVFAVSIYGYPHGFNGTDAFAKAQFPDRTYFYARNNYYGMMCVHFIGSTTHTSNTPDSGHQKNIDTAYSYARSLWPTLVK